MEKVGVKGLMCHASSSFYRTQRRANSVSGIHRSDKSGEKQLPLSCLKLQNVSDCVAWRQADTVEEITVPVNHSRPVTRCATQLSRLAVSQPIRQLTDARLTGGFRYRKTKLKRPHRLSQKQSLSLAQHIMLCSVYTP